VIGVMAVMAILALALMPTELRQIDAAARQKETEALSVMVGGLRNHILDSRSLPAAGTVFSNVARTIGWQLASVQTNARGNPRLYLVDPALRVGTNTAATLPFVQPLLGVTNVEGGRLMLVSGLGQSLPASVTQAGTNAATVFEMLWNAGEDVAPVGWTGGDWADVKIGRLSLLPMFTQVVLRNQSTQTGRFSIDRTNNQVTLPSAAFSSLYLVRTLLGLHSDTGQLQAAQVLQDVVTLTNGPPHYLCPTFVYEDGQWRGEYYKGTSAQKHNGETLQWACELFLSGPPNVYQVGSVTPASLTGKMYLFMSNYVVWAEGGFQSGQKAAVTAAQAAMESELGTYCNPKATTN
jgi:type II secretory pathway pseudopilin PulG